MFSTDKRLGWDGESLFFKDNNNNTRYIDRNEDILYVLTILKTFVSKKLRKNISFTAIHTERIDKFIKREDDEEEEFIYIFRKEFTTLRFSKFKQDDNVYLKITETEHYSKLVKNEYFDIFTNTFKYKYFETLNTNFQLVISEFTARYYIELLSRLNIRF